MPILEEFFYSRKPHSRYRLNGFGHLPGCVCEVCWCLIERALQTYLPGFLPDEPVDPRIVEFEAITSRQRDEINRLREALRRLAPTKAQGPAKNGGLNVDDR